MSEDNELSQLKRKRMLEIRKHYLEKQQKKADIGASKKTQEKMDPERVLRDLFIDRAWEVWEAAKKQYPQVSEQISKAIVAAKQSGRLKDKITGEQLFWLFKRIGLRVRLQTHIRIVESGEIKSIAQKLKGD